VLEKGLSEGPIRLERAGRALLVTSWRGLIRQSVPQLKAVAGAGRATLVVERFVGGASRQGLPHRYGCLKTVSSKIA